MQGSRETAPIVQKLKQQIKENDDIITAQKQEISDTCKAWDRVAAELTTLQAGHNSLRKEHITQKHELNTAKDNIDTLLDNNTKAQDMIKKLTSKV